MSSDMEEVPLLTTDFDTKSVVVMDSQLPLVFRLRGSVIRGIWRQVLLVFTWTVAIVSLYMNVELVQFKWKPTLIQLMGVVCGLLLGFRSNSAYERYWEGRKYWSTMTQGIRTLTRAIWINVDENSTADMVEKKSAINLLVAFAVATKHYLREEYDYHYDDLLSLTEHIDWLRSPSAIANANPKGKHRRSFKAHAFPTPTNIPLYISHLIGSYIKHVRVENKCDGGTVGTMNSALASLVECLTGLERILRTPIPLAYSVHLQQSIWIYILALPFQLVPENGWWTIPVVTIAGFFLLGILEISWEIENPFGYDDNDLPLDDFCLALRREVEDMISQKAEGPKRWIYRAGNKKFSFQTNPSATDLSKNPMEEFQGLLQPGPDQFQGLDAKLNPKKLLERKKSK